MTTTKTRVGKVEDERAIEIAFPMERLGKGDRGRMCNVTC